MTEDNQKIFFALSQKEWESSTDEQKLAHSTEFETEITIAISDNDPEDLGFSVLDWSFIQAHQDEINLDLNDQEKLSLFEDEAEELIESIENDTGEETLSRKYQEDDGKSFSEKEKLELVNDYLSRYGLEHIASWIIYCKLDEKQEREYNLEIANYFYSTWYAENYHVEED